MIHFIKGDLLNSKCNLICHQVNCQGVMRSGVARQIKEKWPDVYEQYCDLVKNNLNYGKDLLGKIQKIKINDEQSVINIFGQYFYNYDGRKYTSYDAFDEALYAIKEKYPTDMSIAFPYRIASDRGGANWRVIRTMIKETLGDRNVFIYYLDYNTLFPEDKEYINESVKIL